RLGFFIVHLTMNTHRPCVRGSKTTILLIRHAHVENPHRILYGRLPRFRLSALGREQAQHTARLLHHIPLAAVFSSPLLRCRQTAREILAFHPDLRLQISTRMTEVHTPYQGMPAAVVESRGGDVYTDAPTGYEQPADIVRRARSFLTSVRKHYTAACVAAVTHGDVIAFVALWACGFALTPANKLRLGRIGIFDAYPAHGSITMLTYHTDDPNERPQVTYRPSPEQLRRMVESRYYPLKRSGAKGGERLFSG
ncbi:MAG: histidine phosphatase family protein, partial [Desulfobacterota bacterium]|nr:histidine phosphatase family protein [Thermodesulfobacteriota bacterium]